LQIRLPIKAVKDYNEYQAATNYSRDYTLNAQEGSYLPALTGNPMLSGMNAGLFANPVDQMRFDGIIPEVDTPTTRNNIVENHGRTMRIMQTETSALLREMRMNIDPNAGKPNLETFPVHYQPKSILFTPDDSSTIAEFGKTPGFIATEPGSFTLPGFAPSMVRTWQETFPDHSTLIDDFDMSVLYKDYLDTVDKINGRYPINGDLAEKQFPLSEDLQDLYPDGVWFKANGHPDFTPYAERTVEVKGLTGAHWKDEQKANEATGFIKTPKDMTWHHVEDGKIMQLVPDDLHHQVKHTGGAAKIKENNKR
jgi:hypothetical protein